MFKIKENFNMFNLKNLGFTEHDFGFYGTGDYIPEYWYTKDYYYKRKRFYIKTNRRFFFSEKSTLLSLALYKDMGNKADKQILFEKKSKIGKIVLKDLTDLGIIEEVGK